MSSSSSSSGGGFDWGGVATAVAGPVISAFSGGNMNRKNRKHQKAINDQNIANQWEMWNATNAYNNPLEQRKRMEQAGFNPNLVYGSGSVANTASQGNVPDAQAGQPMENHVGNAVQGVTDNLMRQKQIEVMSKDIEVKDAEIESKIATAVESYGRSARGAAELDQFKNLRDTAVAQAHEQLQGQRLKNTYQNIKNLNLPQEQKIMLAQMTADLNNKYKTGEAIDVQNEMKRIERDLAKKGLTLNSGMLEKIFAPFIQGAGKRVEKVESYFPYNPRKK